MEHAKCNGLHPTKTSKSYHPTLKQEDEQLNGFLLPVKLQAFEKSLSLKNFVDCTNKLFQQKYSSSSDSDVIEDNEDTKESDSKCRKSVDPDILKSHLYNLQTIGDEREWLKDILLESSEDEDNEISDFDFKEMLKIHAKSKKCEKQLSNDTREQYAFYGSSLLLEQDKYYEHHKRKPPPVNNTKSKTKNTKTVSTREKSKNKAEAKALKQKMQHEKDIAYKRKKLWILIAKKEIPKANKARLNAKGTVLQSLKKLAVSCQRERRKEALRSQKISKDSIPRARRMSREMLLYWRRFDRVEKEHRKKAEKEAMEQRRQDEEMREMKRQQRKLNFLITQTELYAHFMGKKMKGQHESAMQNDILKKLDEPSSTSTRQVIGGVLVNNNTEQYDSDSMKAQALLNVQTAVLKQKQKASTFEDSEKKSAMMNKFDGSFSLSETSTKENLPQPKIFEGKLKAYQLKGMNWLVSLYEKGINGILADEMGLGKTVQSISFLSYLAETHNIWGPFLVVAPASTLHNWQQEFSKFLPRFKVLPYWGDPSDRKSLRKFWNQSSYVVNSKENAPFHVLITSYQLIVQDVKYFQRIKWQYLVLDEAQAIKSSSSIRWKILLGYNCRNRLLLTGTPIQNTMAELWALLHFIMPTLFDSHEEFNEWFSKDIEGAATDKKPSLNQDQLSRLHMILKPFMLRRIKKDVENELSEKIEIKVMCNMSNRQKELYQSVKNKIVIEDILTSATTPAETKTSSLLMNLVMQFRKVCNHPDLFERKEAVRGVNVHPSPLLLPKLIYRDGLLNRSKLHSMSARNLDIWTENHIHTSMRENGNCFDFSIFTDLSPRECANLFKSIVQRLLFIIRAYDQQQRIQHACRLRSSKSHLLNRKDLYICTPYVSEKFQLTATISSFNRMKPCNRNLLIRDEISETAKFQRLEYPNFLTTVYPKACVRPVEVYCSDASYCNQRMESPELIRLLQSGVNEDRSHMLFPPPLQGLDAARPHNGWSLVKVPDCSTLTTDSGKLTVLDQLLSRLKKENHRVLIYSQMTKMIDILEDFMRFRKHSFMRLDGSSKISDRRDMVSDFQSRDDIFAFLLSTRAGGLGINLTAADTVIFYDSDWNPTVDQQAMDRAHRLGQKKQVTVYRLVTKGTVEEKILIRAREKSEIQNIIISGGQFSKETLKPKEVASLLLDDVELASKLKQRRQERKVDEKQKPGRKRKADTSNTVSEKKRSIVENGVSDIDETSMSSLDLEYESISESHRPPTPTRGRGRGRGKSKAGSLAKAAASAAAMAGAAAGSAKAYAAYGYSFQKTT